MQEIEIKINKTGMVYLDKTWIGRDMENLQKEFVFTFTDEFITGSARLEYILSTGEKHNIPLILSEKSYRVPIRNVMTKAGTVTLQFVIVESENEYGIPVFKSNIFTLQCAKSINAETEAPDDYEYWLNILQEKIAEVENINIDSQQQEQGATITITNKDGSTDTIELKDGKDGKDGEDGYTPQKGIDYFDGEKGESGVYIGENPSEEDNVWIDPSGEPDTFDAKEVIFTDGKNLQYKLDNGELGGGGSVDIGLSVVNGLLNITWEE